MKERNKPELRAYNTIAVIQTAFLGDVALALPLAQAIKNEHHSCRLLFVTTPQAEELVKLSDAVDKVIVYDKRRIHNGLAGIRQISEILKENKTELIISPHRSLRTTLLSRFAKPKLSIGFDVNSFSFLYDFRVKYRTEKHEIDRDLSLL
ncbi:MAG: heptosyltransferase, partial [Bacteroidota bacterium]|nr:heptosyltransferase [Bacteroidota bacterium]